jgi:endoglucanase
VQNNNAFFARLSAARSIRRLAWLAFTVVGGCDAAQALTATDPPGAGANRLVGARLFVNPNTPAARQASEWRASRPGDAALMDRIASQPVASWMGGWNSDIRRDVASVVSRAGGAGSTPVFVAYNIPNRDCGSYSAGGAGSAAGYKQWIRDFAAGLTGKTVVVLEPDAVAGAGCLSTAAREERNTLLRDAIQVLKAAQAVVYLDAGHAAWHSPDAIATRLEAAGIDQADGFSLNVSNYLSTDRNVTYGDAVSARVGGKHYLIDTSRNGLGGVSGQWCNVEGQALGDSPTTDTGHLLLDALLWVKYPGESDGTCNGGPSAGGWWAEYALGLAQRQTVVAGR